MASSRLTLSDLESSNSRSLRFWVEGDLNGINIFTRSNITTLFRCHRRYRSLLAGGGFPLSQQSLLLNPAFAWRGFLLSLCVSVRPCVRLTDNKISQKLSNRSTSLLVEAFPVTQGGNHSILNKKLPWDKGGSGGGVSKFGPNDKR